jgi:hypothetical protein
VITATALSVFQALGFLPATRRAFSLWKFCFLNSFGQRGIADVNLSLISTHFRHIADSISATPFGPVLAALPPILTAPLGDDVSPANSGKKDSPLFICLAAAYGTPFDLEEAIYVVELGQPNPLSAALHHVKFESIQRARAFKKNQAVS